MSNARSRMGAYGRIPKDLLRDGTISARAKAVVAMVDEVAGYEDITMARLGEWLGCSEDSARRAVKEARDAGWVEVQEQRGPGGRQAPSMYVANAWPFQTDEDPNLLPPPGVARVPGRGSTRATPRGCTGATPYKERDYETDRADKPAPKPKRGTRIPDDWEPSPDLLAWCQENHPGVNLTLEVPKFRDYWTAKAGQTAVKLDWDATFRNWARNATQYAPQRTQTPARAGEDLKALSVKRRSAQAMWLEARGSSLEEYEQRKNEPGWLDRMKAMEVDK